MDSDLRQSPPQSWGRRGATAAPQAQKCSSAAWPARVPVRSESGCQRYSSWHSSNPFRHSSAAMAAILPVKHHHVMGVTGDRPRPRDGTAAFNVAFRRREGHRSRTGRENATRRAGTGVVLSFTTDGTAYPQAFCPRFSSLAQTFGSLARVLRRRSHCRSTSRPTANTVNLPRACPRSLRSRCSVTNAS